MRPLSSTGRLSGLILGVALIGAGAVWGLFGRATEPARESGSPSENADHTEVVLGEAKLAAAGVRVESCEARALRDVRVVPGRITHDESRHVTVRLPVDGVVRSVLVKPGDEVRAGDTLAVVSSPAVGSARADVLQRDAELAQATRRHEWETQVTANTETLVRALESKPDLPSVEKSLEGKTLGDYREKLLSAYSKYVLADALTKQLQPLADQGFVEGRVARERTSNRQVAEAAFRGLCEQTLFDARQKSDAARAAEEDARRRMRISRHHLASLVGKEETQIAATDDSLSLVEVRAPISGTVEERSIAAAERVSAGDGLFVVADITRLWVTADLREKDWDVTGIEEGAEISVQLPALANRSIAAKVHFVGRSVNGLSHSIPLVAEIDNTDRALRPGMFARVSVPVGKAAGAPEAVAVRAASVLDHDGRNFVFVESQPGRYRRADIELGRRTPEWVEVVRGVRAGDRVVVGGAFVLKSELLLESEE